MEPPRKTTFQQKTQNDEFEVAGGDPNLTERRLNSLLRENARFDKRNSLFSSEKERLEADLMESPFSAEQAFSYFGLLLGTFPPAAFFGKFIFESDPFSRGDGWVVALLLLANVASAIAGFFSGKLIGKAVLSLEKYRWWEMLFMMPFLGFLWGAIAGGTGGIFLFLIGAVFGAIIGGAVGAAALPVFSIFHRIFKRGDQMDRNDFLPIAFGITLAISALIIGFPV